MNELKLNPIGKVEAGADGGSLLRLDKEYREGLLELKGFSHIMVLYWCHHLDDQELRKTMVHDSPYRSGPDKIGVFATRSPLRPNPIAVSCARVLELNEEEGTILLDYLDAEPDSPLLDIKPYTPSADRSSSATPPAWCAHWPKDIETSGDFDWAAEFNFID